jgi:ElaB/YqjD/DUF883 family membrane-anchored ribosome-binding protein
MSDSRLSDEVIDVADDADMQKVTDKLKQTFEASIDAITSVSASTIEAAKDAAISADEFVQENPWLALFVAAGVAGAVGYFVGRATVPRRRYWLQK